MQNTINEVSNSTSLQMVGRPEEIVSLKIIWQGRGRHKKLARLCVAVENFIGKNICLGNENLLMLRGAKPIFYMRVGK